jgi:hypothetical protein
MTITKDLEISLFFCSKIERRDTMASSKIKGITIEIDKLSIKYCKKISTQKVNNQSRIFYVNLHFDFLAIFKKHLQKLLIKVLLL